MEAELSLKVTVKEKSGKGPSRRLRMQGLIPAVVYGGQDHLNLVVNPIELKKLLIELGGKRSIMSMAVEDDSKVRMVILKDTQTDPLTDELLHADFLEISMDKEITVEIPIHMSGESEQAKSGEGVVDQLLDFVVVECLPGIIPRELIIDTSGLVIGQVLHVSDLEVPEGVKVFRDPQIPVASMSSTQARMEALEALEAPEEEAEEVDEDAEEVEGEGAEAEEGSEEDKG